MEQLGHGALDPRRFDFGSVTAMHMFNDFRKDHSPRFSGVAWPDLGEYGSGPVSAGTLRKQTQPLPSTVYAATAPIPVGLPKRMIRRRSGQLRHRILSSRRRRAGEPQSE